MGKFSVLEKLLRSKTKLRLIGSAVLLVVAITGIVLLVSKNQYQAHAAGTTKYAVNAGGNWGTNATWSTIAAKDASRVADTTKPTTGDIIIIDDYSGSVAVNEATAAIESLDMTGHLGTLTGSSAINITNTNNAACKFAGTTSWTGLLTLTPATTKTLTLTPNSGLFSLTIAGAGQVTLAGAYSAPLLDINQTNGTFNTAGYAVTTRRYLSNTSVAHTLALGASTFTCAYAGIAFTSNNYLTITDTGNTSNIIISGAGASVSISGTSFPGTFSFTGGGAMAVTSASGATYVNFTCVATAQTWTLSFSGTQTVSGTLTLQGNSTINRLEVISSVLGTARTLNAAAVDLDNVDFQDMTGAGAAAPFSGVSIGECESGARSKVAMGINYDDAVDQYWINDATGDWDDSANWTSRVPLPQDNVYISRDFATTKTITVDMPRMGKNISFDFAGARTANPTVLMNVSGLIYTNYGLLNLSDVGTFTSNKSVYFQARVNSSLTSNGKTITTAGGVYFQTVGVTFTLNDAFVSSTISEVALNNGTLTAVGDVTLKNFVASAGTTTNLGNGTWHLNNEGTQVWQMSGSIGSAGNSTISIEKTSDVTFNGGTNQTYNNITIIQNASVITFANAFTFANMTMASAGTKTVKFAAGTTFTMTGTNFLSGTSGNVVTIFSDTAPTAFIISKSSGTVTSDYISLRDCTGTGGATWRATHSTSVPTNTNWTFVKSAVAAGGNWTAGATWWDGVAPTATSDVFLDSVSGTGGAVVIDAGAVARSVDCTGYTGTLTHTAGVNLAIGDGAGSASYGNVALKLVAGMTYTPGTTATLSFISTNATAQTITWGTKTPGNLTFNGTGATWQFQDTLSASAITLTHTAGTLNTNNQTVTISQFVTSGSTAKVLALGTSSLTAGLAGVAWNASGSNFSSTGTTSNIILNGAGASFTGGAFSYPGTVQLTGSGTATINGINTFVNLTRTGTAVRTDILSLPAAQTISGIVTFNGSSATDRLLVRSDTLGTARILTVSGATFSTNNVDFQDITFARTTAGGLDLTNGGANLIGDCGGNTRTGGDGTVTFTTPSTQTWSGASGGSWSTNAWSGRVPLPQDTVAFGAMDAAQSITVDMPRMGKDISFAGATNTPTVLMNSATAGTYTIYGLLNLTGVGTFTHDRNVYFQPRVDKSITSGGKIFDMHVYFQPIGCILTLADAFSQSYNKDTYLTNGTLSAVTNVSVGSFQQSSGTVTNMGGGTWTLSNAGVMWTGSGTINKETANIAITYAGTTSTTFAGGTNAYNNITITPPTTTGTLTLSGTFTFANMTMASAGAKTIKFTAGTTFTMSGTNFLSGTTGNEVTIDSTTTGTYNLVKSGGGSVGSHHLNIQHSVATPANTWYAASSTNNQGVATAGSGWNFVDGYVISPTGGNWSDTTAWMGGVVPTNADDVTAVAGSGNLTINGASACKSINLTNYTGTLTHNAGATLSVGNASGGLLTFVAGMNYAPADATAIISFVSSTTGNNITTGGKTLGSVVFNNAAGGWSFVDTTAIGGNLTITNSEVAGNGVNFNNQAINLTGNLALDGGKLTAGSSAIGVAGNWTRTGGTLVAGTSTVTFNAGATGKTITSGGQTFKNVVFSNAAGGWSFIDTTAISGNLTVTNSETVANGVNLNGQAINLTGNLALDGGKLTAGSSAIGVGGNWTRSGGTLVANTSTVTFSGSGLQTITSGGQSFANLTITNASVDGVSFADGATTSATFTDLTDSSKLTFHSGSTYSFNTLDIAASATDHRIILQPSGATNWIIAPTNVTKVSYVDVSKSTNSGISFCATYSNDGTGNLAWLITTNAYCAPTDLVATSGQTTISLVWENPGDPNLNKIKVYRGLAPGFTLPEADMTAEVALPNHTYVDDTVVNNVNYYYKVTSFDNALVESGPSSEVTGRSDNDPPTTPGKPSVTEPTIIAEGHTIIAQKNMTFVWDPSVDLNSGLKNYYLSIGTTTGGTQIKNEQVVAPDTPSYGYTFVSDGIYYVRVFARDNMDNQSATSDEFVIYVDTTAPTRPTSVTANPAGYTATNSFEFTWPAGTDAISGVKWYEYRRFADGAWSHTADPTDRTVSAVVSYKAGANIFYVRTVDNAGNTSDNAQVTYYYSGTAPPKPNNVAVNPASATENSFTLTWDKPAVEEGAPPIVGYYYSINTPPTATNTTYVANTGDHISVGPDAFATQQGENTLYVVSRDEAGTSSFLPAYYATDTFSCETPAPPAPVSVVVYDSSDKTYQRFMLTVQWQAGSGQDPATFDHYLIERSTNGSTFTSLATVSNALTYLDANSLSDSATYYYRIKAVDNAGSTSAASSIVSRQPSGKYSTPPTVTSGPTIEHKANQVTIRWTTDRPSTSFVRYGTVADAAKGIYPGSTGDFTLVTSHEVVITGLEGETQYYFQIQSVDAERDYSSESAFQPASSFVTLASPSISNVSVSNITLTSADISWVTTTLASSSAEYGTTTAYGQSVRDISSTSTTEHSAKITGLDHSSTYHFKISGSDTDGNTLSSDDYSFETLALPTISNFKITEVKDRPSATIKATWDTNVPATTVLEFSFSGKKTTERAKSKLETSHEIEIDALADNTVYSFIAKSVDQFGDIVTSSPATYMTPFDTRPAIISNIVIETSNVGLGQRDSAQVVVSWKTDEPATSMVEYGAGITGDTNQKTIEDKAMKTVHLVIVSGLKPSTVYHIKAVSKDRGNNTTTSKDNVIIAGEVRRSVFDIIMNALAKIFGWAGKVI